MMKIIAKGRPASSGMVVGKVRIVHDVKGLSNVKDGEILVVNSSNPAWTIGMMKASGLISEYGGIICHAAIVAREIGIPCVVGVKDATSNFQDGQKIKIDGDEGIIYEE